MKWFPLKVALDIAFRHSNRVVTKTEGIRRERESLSKAGWRRLGSASEDGHQKVLSFIH
ncbi:mCG147779 [Mus musculus]|nr:mCG147779 [Mus musculus]